MVDRKRPHLVIYPDAAQGHVTPMMQLAKRLSEKGFMVTFVNTEHIISQLVKSQSKAGIDLPQQIRLVGISDGLPEQREPLRIAHVPELVQRLESLAQPFAEMVKQINRQEGAPITCIISDIVHSHTQEVAVELGIPWVAFLTPSACAVSMYLHAPLLVEKGIVPVEGSGQELVTCIPGVHPVPRAALPTFLTEGGFMLGRMIRNGKRVLTASWLLLNTFHDLEGPVLDALSRLMPTLSIGPLLPLASFYGHNETSSRTDENRHGTGFLPEDISCLSWLDKQLPSSVLYISFGSISNLTKTQFEELALGIQASKQPSLWVIRPDAGREVFTLLEALEMTSGSVGFVTTWAPQLQVLSHKSVGGFLTHCGWNSTLESISAGVPMLCWPDYFEQVLNAVYITEVWKIGLGFRKADNGLVTRDEVERVVKSFMQQQGVLRDAVVKLAKAGRESVLPGGSSHQNLERFVSFLIMTSK